MVFAQVPPFKQDFARDGPSSLFWRAFPQGINAPKAPQLPQETVRNSRYVANSCWDRAEWHIVKEKKAKTVRENAATERRGYNKKRICCSHAAPSACVFFVSRLNYVHSPTAAHPPNRDLRLRFNERAISQDSQK